MSRLHRDELVGLFLALLMILWAASHAVMRSDYWFEVVAFDVRDVTYGDPITIHYERKIARQFSADWRVNVRRKTDRGLEFVCSSPTRRDDYEPTAVLPEPVTLEWFAFTDPRCFTLHPGQYQITVTWDLNHDSLIFHRTVRVSDEFEVAP